MPNIRRMRGVATLVIVPLGATAARHSRRLLGSISAGELLPEKRQANPMHWGITDEVGFDSDATIADSAKQGPGPDILIVGRITLRRIR